MSKDFIPNHIVDTLVDLLGAIVVIKPQLDNPLIGNAHLLSIIIRYIV